MIVYPPPRFDQQKNEVLQRYRILNGAEVYCADEIAGTAAQVFGVPIVVAALNERYRTWYKSACGVSGAALERLQAFCARAGLSDTEFAVPDARAEAVFASDPAVTEAPHVVFFAGAPLRDPDGNKLCAMCRG